MDNSSEPKPRLLDFRDAAGLVGIMLITGGVAMIHVPAALIVSGTLILGGAVLSARRS